MSDTDAMDVQYFTYDGRLASFQKTTKKRASTTGGRGAKALNWPHKRITAASLARAGFYFFPTPDHPDNVICFLCHKGLDGWEEGDDPLQEHLNHTADCGWATVAAIEAEIGEFHLEDPSSPHMIAARNATFAGRWPHDSKRGWKCKTKQLADSGWKYTPTVESDDMATCVYCQLALDGWEPSDKPLDEHYKRSPTCPFFTLVSQSHGTTKKAPRGKAARGSKASRLSTQSIVTTAPSEIGSVDELMVAQDHDDTVMTTASTMTAGGKKPRAKKAAATKGRKTKAKKEETVEPEEPPAMLEEPVVAPVIVSPPKPKRGKKRSSDAIEESTPTAVDAPVPKKRATRGRVSKSVEPSVMIIEPSVINIDSDTELPETAPPAKKAAGRKKSSASATKATRKTSTASRASSTALTAARGVTADLLDDDEEIERQLQADLERPLTDDEDIMADSDSERFKAKAKTSKSRKTTSTTQSAEFAMFDPQPMEADDAAVEAELRQLEAEMQLEETEQLQVPKKGRKAGTRKVSKQTKTKKTKEPELELEAEPEMPVIEPAEPLVSHEIEEEQQNVSLGSTDTVVHKIEVIAPKKRGRPSKASLASAASAASAASVIAHDVEADIDALSQPEEASAENELRAPLASQQPVKRPRGRPSKASLASQNSLDGHASFASAANTSQAPVKRPRGRPKKVDETRQSVEPSYVPVMNPAPGVPKAEPSKVSYVKTASKKSLIHDEQDDDEIYEEPLGIAAIPQPAPATPPKVISKAQSAKQATISPSPSPQSSDAENQPSSSRPSASTKRIALAPISETPVRLSPSKRNIIAGLQSTTPWTTVDIDAVLGTPRPGVDKENGAERLIRKGKDLTSPEKQMTVEEWIKFNAEQAEQMLKNDCEAMVSRFETEGTWAMKVLDGLVVDP